MPNTANPPPVGPPPKFITLSFEDHPVRMAPDGAIAARDLFEALGKVRSSFSAVVNRHPSIREYIREFRFDRRGPNAFTITRAGLNALDNYIDDTPALDRFRLFLDSYEKGEPEDSAYAAFTEIQQALQDTYKFLQEEGLSMSGNLIPRYNKLIVQLQRFGIN